MSSETKTVGQINFEEFSRVFAKFHLQDARDIGLMDRWEGLDEGTKKAWEAAAYAVLKSQIVTNNA